MSKKLLLADDSITIQKVIQITFAHEDFELTITDNGDTAFVKAQEIKPDLVLADIYMPGKNGYELTQAIKQDPALQHVPVLLLAGSFEPFDEDRARSCKADAWIEKPFESQSLIDKVTELLSSAQAAPAPAAVVEEVPLPAVEEAAFVAPATAEISEDPFADISFEDQPPVAEPESFDAADDWSDVVLEPEVAAPVAAETFVAQEEPVMDDGDDFIFTEEVTPADAFVTEEASLEPGFDSLAMNEDEIMPLGDDDILAAEDLEPVLEEQTLAAWSRTETDADDVFVKTVEEEPIFVDEPVFVAPVEPVFEEEQPVFATEEPVAETGPAEQSEPAVREFEPADVAAAMTEVDARASALSETEIEQIVEKVITKVVEKLAGTILERVAWEVVPDLAENLIREEIRKIKDAAA